MLLLLLMCANERIHSLMSVTRMVIARVFLCSFALRLSFAKYYFLYTCRHIRKSKTKHKKKCEIPEKRSERGREKKIGLNELMNGMLVCFCTFHIVAAHFCSALFGLFYTILAWVMCALHGYGFNFLFFISTLFFLLLLHLIPFFSFQASEKKMIFSRSAFRMKF